MVNLNFPISCVKKQCIQLNRIQIYFVYTAFLYCMHPVFWLFYPLDIEPS